MIIRKEVKIGMVTILCVIIIYLGIIFLKGLRLFGSGNIYYVSMNNAAGLSAGSDVYANGLIIGQVKAIDYDQSKQKITATIELNEGFILTKGSMANVTSEMLSSPKLNISLNPDISHPLAVGDTICSVESMDLMATAAEMVPSIQAMLPKLDSILTAVNTVVNDPALQNTLANTEQMTANLNGASAELNGIMKRDMPRLLQRDVPQLLEHDLPQLFQKANNICENLEVTTNNMRNVDMAHLSNNANKTMEDLQLLVNNLNAQLNDLKNSEGTLGKMMYDPSVYNQLDSTLRSATLLLNDLKQHPKRYVHFSVFGRKDK